MTKVVGSQIDLSAGRHVFYGQGGNYHYFRFRNCGGKETKFKLSEDATDALVRLLTEPAEISRWIVYVRAEPRDAITWGRV